MEYNTERPDLLLREYGRNVQKLVEHISTIEDKQQRTAYAHTLIHLMKILNPAVRENSDNPQRIWDHLHIMSGFKLDIDGPFPKPDPDTLTRPPERMEYKGTEVRYRNYGRNIDLLVDKALETKDDLEQISAFVQIGRLIKSFYSSWHKENIEDKAIILQLKNLSRGKVDLTETWEASGETLFNSPSGGGNNQGNQNSSNQQGNNSQNRSNRRQHNKGGRRGRFRRNKN